MSTKEKRPTTMRTADFHTESDSIHTAILDIKESVFYNDGKNAEVIGEIASKHNVEEEDVQLLFGKIEEAKEKFDLTGVDIDSEPGIEKRNVPKRDGSKGNVVYSKKRPWEKEEVELLFTMETLVSKYEVQKEDFFTSVALTLNRKEPSVKQKYYSTMKKREKQAIEKRKEEMGSKKSAPEPTSLTVADETEETTSVEDSSSLKDKFLSRVSRPSPTSESKAEVNVQNVDENQPQPNKKETKGLLELMKGTISNFAVIEQHNNVQGEYNTDITQLLEGIYSLTQIAADNAPQANEAKIKDARIKALEQELEDVQEELTGSVTALRRIKNNVNEFNELSDDRKITEMDTYLERINNLVETSGIAFSKGSSIVVNNRGEIINKMK